MIEVAATPRRRWFRFSLRTMLVVVTLVCCYLGWQLRMVQERKDLLREIDALSWSEVRLMPLPDYMDDGTVDLSYCRVSSLRRLLGDEACLSIDMPILADPKLIERVENAFPEAMLRAKSPPDMWEELVGLHPPQTGENAFRDSLYRPAAARQKNSGTLFKTGLPR